MQTSTDRTSGESEPPARSTSPPVVGVFSGVRVVGLCTLASRVLGLIRDIGMASLFGAGPVMDAFSVAFRVPNLFRRLFGEGALTAAFLPLFVRETQRDGLESGWRLSSAVLAALTVALVALTVVGELVLAGLWWFVPLGPEARLLVGLTAAMLPYVILICLAAQLAAMLNGLNRFAWPALVPVLMNLIWIGGLVLVAPRFSDPERQAYALSGCILVAGVFQVVAQWPPLARAGFRFSFEWAWAKGRLRALGAAMTPVLLGLGVAQVNTVADSALAWLLAPGAESSATMPLPGNPAWPVSAGAASALYFGQRLYQFPLGIFGVALSTVMFPRLATHAESGRMDLLRDDLQLGLRMVLAIGLPASAGLMLLSEPITALFFEHGAFDSDDLRRTASVVAAYGVAVWAWCGLLILTRAAYAAGDRLTPLRLSVWAVGLNLVLNLILVWPLGGTGLALATSITSIAQTLALGWRLQRSVGRLDVRNLALALAKSLAATLLMAAVGFAALAMLPESESLVGRVIRVVAPFAASVAVWFGAATLLRIDEVRLLLHPGGESSRPSQNGVGRGEASDSSSAE